MVSTHRRILASLLPGQLEAKMATPVKEKPAEIKNCRGFVAGVFSGIAKLSGE